MIKTVSSIFLIDAPASALNNAGPDVGARTDNSVAVKKFKKGNREFPYISAQMLRYEWRKLLIERCEWVMSPITREKKIAFTGADPFNYPDDDIFGYMKAKSKAKAVEKDKKRK